MENVDLKFLKKNYGENFAHMCRSLFPTILEEEGKLSEIISSKFAPTHSLFEEIKSEKLENSFKNFIYRIYNSDKIVEAKANSNKTPQQLFDEAGYILYPECKTEDDIQQFLKYYAYGEQICTFDGGRLESCRVWFAVKKDVDNIRRINFTQPQRQDEYGTSVISIQYTKGGNSTLSIKNRYNHTVDNPDATFSNNLDNIIAGLSNSFEKFFKIGALTQEDHFFSLTNFVKGSDGRFYRYNIERMGTYFCENNTIIDCDSNIIKLDKSSFLLVDEFVVDLKEKTITSYLFGDRDSFVESVRYIKDIKVIKNEKGEKVIVVIPLIGENINITVDCFNQIKEYSNPNAQAINFQFLRNNKGLKKIDLPNVEYIDDQFLFENKVLEEINIPKLNKVGDFFLANNIKLKEINFPKLKTTGSAFLYNNKSIEKINLPKLEKLGHSCFYLNDKIKSLSLPKVKVIGENCFYTAVNATEVNLPELKELGAGFMYWNNNLKIVNMPN
ncbi:MAG: leucine-rich repeat protein, partial [Christensenellales bacterium]